MTNLKLPSFWNWIKMIGLSAAIAYLFAMTQLMWGLVNGYSWAIYPDWANYIEFPLALLKERCAKGK